METVSFQLLSCIAGSARWILKVFCFPAFWQDTPRALLRAHTITERFHFTLCAEHMVLHAIVPLASALNCSHIGTGDNRLSVKSWISKVWWI